MGTSLGVGVAVCAVIVDEASGIKVVLSAVLSEHETSNAEQSTPASRGQAIFMKEFLIISLP